MYMSTAYSILLTAVSHYLTARACKEIHEIAWAVYIVTWQRRVT